MKTSKVCEKIYRLPCSLLESLDLFTSKVPSLSPFFAVPEVSIFLLINVSSLETTFLEDVVRTAETSPHGFYPFNSVILS